MKVGRLLIVEDELALQEIMADILIFHVEKVDRANDGRQAVEMIEKNTYDAIISDLKMPKMTGMELLEWVRKSNRTTPFIILTGYGDEDTMAKARKLGVTDFLDKPAPSDQIIQVVMGAVSLGIEKNKKSKNMSSQTTVKKKAK